MSVLPNSTFNPRATVAHKTYPPNWQRLDATNKRPKTGSHVRKLGGPYRAGCRGSKGQAGTAQDRIQHAIAAIAVSEAHKLVVELQDVFADVAALKNRTVALQLPSRSVPADCITPVFADQPTPQASADDKKA
jgi:hypothetical protein